MDVYASLFQNCGDAVVIADDQSHIVFANSSALALFQNDLSVLTAPTASGRLQLLAIGEENTTCHLGSPLQQVLTGKNFQDCEFLLRTSPNNPDLWLSITGSPFAFPDQSMRGGLLIIRDISRYKVESFDELQEHDHNRRTGLVSRRVFMDRINHALTRAKQQGGILVAILCLDLRRLKAVNDTFGYTVGDDLLVAVAKRLLESLSPTDTLSRLGGDEFTILLEDVVSFSQVAAIAENIKDGLLSPFEIQGHPVQIDASIGISLGNSIDQTPQILLRQADIAMHRAKQAFGEKYCVFKDSMRVTNDHFLNLEIDLKAAIERQEFFLEYQPIFLIRNQDVIGMESLVRWRHPEQGVLPPSEFIPLAEKTGLIVPLGWWIFEESCRQLKQWQENIPATQSLFISVNMSSQQFAQKDLPDQIRQVLDMVGLPARCLRIEITEGVLIDNSTSIIETLNAIRKMGVKLSIDDFGTGYSSLSYLHKFPFDTLKIDRSFLENADSDFEKLEILQSMVRLAWNLGLEVVAEGIETPKHFAQIKALRCESGQGFLFSQPLRTAAMEEMLRNL
jgi:diguanylate cyclase (GGDEF)-like protein